MSSKRRLEYLDMQQDNDGQMSAYLSGEKLYGDHFNQVEIDAWFRDEEVGYYSLGSGIKSRYEYGYHALNMEYGFRFLPETEFSHVLGIGSAYGDELLPIAGKSRHITILEPAEGFVVSKLGEVTVDYKKPQSSGLLDFPRDTLDLITCLGVLHHIPNVSIVMKEFFRCLKPGGYALIREPIISLGDWRKPRKGLTKRERGIPLNIFREIVQSAGFEILQERKCMFSLTSRLRYVLRGPVYNSRLAVVVDKILCSLPIWSDKYHPTSLWDKLRPASVYFVLKKSSVLQ